MEKLDPSVAEQIAQAAIAFQQQRTGHEPQSVAVVLSGDTLMITLHGALSPAEKVLSQSPEALLPPRVSPAVVRQLLRRTAAGDQADNRGRSSRSDRGSRNDDGHRGAGLHDRHDGAGVFAHPPRTRRQLERKRFQGFILRREVRRCWHCLGKITNRW